MSFLVVMVEEASARIVVEALLPRLFPEHDIKVLSHEGKRELEMSFPRKIGAWQFPVDTRFLILRDNDGGDCRQLKSRLTKLVPV